MKFFIDTANLEQIQEAYDLGVLDGVTTNSSLISVEVIATDYEGMIREGEELAALNPHIEVKVPCIADGIKAIKYFTEKGIRTNCTLSVKSLIGLGKPFNVLYLVWQVYTNI